VGPLRARVSRDARRSSGRASGSPRVALYVVFAAPGAPTFSPRVPRLSRNTNFKTNGRFLGSASPKLRSATKRGTQIFSISTPLIPMQTDKPRPEASQCTSTTTVPPPPAMASRIAMMARARAAAENAHDGGASSEEEDDDFGYDPTFQSPLTLTAKERLSMVSSAGAGSINTPGGGGGGGDAADASVANAPPPPAFLLEIPATRAQCSRFNGDGGLLATGCEDGSVKVHSTSTGRASYYFNPAAYGGDTPAGPHISIEYCPAQPHCLLMVHQCTHAHLQRPHT